MWILLNKSFLKCNSVQFSCSVMSNSLWPHGLQHTRSPCPSQLLELTQTHVHRVSDVIQSSSVVSFSSLQSSPASGSFPMSQFFTSGGQSIGASALASVLPMNIQIYIYLFIYSDLFIQEIFWFPLGWISLQSKGLSKVFSNTTVKKHQFFSTQPSLWSKSHIHTWLLEKP